MACCPAHNDKNPSLSIKETKDGDVLLHCFAGCGVDDVVAALGLEMSDLFSKQAIMVSSTHNTFTAEDVLVALVDDLNVLCCNAIDPQTARAHFLEALEFIKGLS
jgi:protein tyrosine phosphatase